MMCASAMLLTNNMLDRLWLRLFTSDSIAWIPSTSPLAPRAWISLVTQSLVGNWSADNMALKFSIASVEEGQEVENGGFNDSCVSTCLVCTFTFTLLALGDDD